MAGSTFPRPDPAFHSQIQPLPASSRIQFRLGSLSRRILPRNLHCLEQPPYSSWICAPRSLSYISKTATIISLLLNKRNRQSWFVHWRPLKIDHTFMAMDCGNILP
ncbi:hypothetical protein KSP40_PGU005955 [Platanthera guangdongensis]|uniref:Uncharacterized protein n=1 Tax=Platanthera guangdongensis TaxID=2320717 RepID=A0ABR2N104_9ASPA